jgi:hypothetical protein
MPDIRVGPRKFALSGSRFKRFYERRKGADAFVLPYLLYLSPRLYNEPL